ncbi:MAG: hypothetical protein J7L53_07610 [Deltaproteobacteria bacterium]|nr:hypothetical protein [Deltaproteobacteria bacterium]
MSRKGMLNMIMKNMDSQKATKILAKTLYKELKKNGFSNKAIIDFSGELIEYLAQDVRNEQASKKTLEQDRSLIG